MDWSSFTKGYFLNRDTLVGVLLLIDASIPPQKIDLDCANWLGRNNVRCYIPSLTVFFYLLFLNLMLGVLVSCADAKYVYNDDLCLYSH